MKTLSRLLLLLVLCILPQMLFAQGVTTAAISGTVTEESEPLIGVTIQAIHEPSGTLSGTITNMDGQFIINGLRVGGPYTIKVSYIGYRTHVIKDIILNLGDEMNFNVNMEQDVAQLGEVVVDGTRAAAKRSLTAGVGMVLGSQTFQTAPTVSRSLDDFTRMLPQAGASGMMGKGGKSNNVTVDGATFTNLFGLGGETSGLPGVNAGSQPLSLDALDQISVEASPYSVKVGGFTGAGINVVTKSGDNTFRASVYDFYRNQDFAGHKVGKDGELSSNDYNNNTLGFRISGPIIKNKLFFFANFETVKSTEPFSNYVLGDGSGTGNVSTVPASTANELRDFVQKTYNYNMGAYDNVDKNITSTKFLIKLDWNINENHKFTLRYNQLNAKNDQGSMTGGTNCKFENLTYNRNNDIYNLTAELNSKFTQNLSNKFFASINSMPDYRQPKGERFPLVNITNHGAQISFGADAAAFENRVEQKVYQIQDELTYLYKKNTFTAGINWQFMDLSNSFTYNPSGTFTFNTLEDFYNSAPAGTQTPIGTSTGEGRPTQYTLGYTTQEGRNVTLSNPKISQLGLYLQDDIKFNNRFSLTAGLRADIIAITNKPQDNPDVSAMTFQDADGKTVKFNTTHTPKTSVLFSPRVGFNWKLDEEGHFVLKGGSGLFTGNIPFVYLEKMFGINGLNENSISVTKAGDLQNYPFNATPAYYKPAGGSAAATYEIDLVDEDYKMPQTWRSSLALDWLHQDGWKVSLEGVYSKDYHNPYYTNANLDQTTTDKAADGRTHYTNNRLNQKVTGAILLKECNLGYSYFLTANVRKSFVNGLAAGVSYTFGETKSPFEFASTTPKSALTGNPCVGNPNKPVLSYATYDLRHRLIADVTYTFKYNKDKLYTTVSLFMDASQQGRNSYIYGGSGDVNGDSYSNNDLIFIPRTLADINLAEYTSGGKTITVEEQWKALDAFIEKSDYLREHRGEYAERNGAIAPWRCQFDLHLAQGLKLQKTHGFEITFDFKNFMNMFNSEWGNIYSATNTTLITANKNGTFNVNPTNLEKDAYIPYLNASSAWSMQIGVRYTFN